jgi:hypothetical protein
MLPKPTREEIEQAHKTLRGALQEYYKVLARDFNHVSDAEDEDFLDSEMKRTEDFLVRFDEDAMNELREWSATEGMVD